MAAGGLDGDFGGALQPRRAGATKRRGELGKILGDQRERDHALAAADLSGGDDEQRALADRQHRARAVVHRDFRETEERLKATGRLLDVLGADHQTLEAERRGMARRLARRWRGELDEHAAARARMQERDAAGDPLARRGVDQLGTTILQAHERGADVRRLEAQMVQPLPASGEEAADPRRRVERLEELDLRVAGGEQGGAHPLRGDRLFLEQRQSEHVAIEPVGVRQALHDDADVMDASHHVTILLTARTPRRAELGRRGCGYDGSATASPAARRARTSRAPASRRTW